MRRLPQLLFALGLSTLGCTLASGVVDKASARPQPLPAPRAVPSKRLSVEQRIRRIEHGLALPVLVKGLPDEHFGLAERMRLYHAPAVSVAVINNGRIEWARAWGIREAGKADRADADTLFAAGSISKPVAAMGALRMVQDGRLSLSDDVNVKLKSWRVPGNEFTKLEKVTLGRLLNHTSGLGLFAGNGQPEPSLISLADALSGKGPNSEAVPEFVPGARQQYSSAGYGTIQLLMSDVAGKEFDPLMRELVFQPLGMTRSRYSRTTLVGRDRDVARGHDSMTGEVVDPTLPSSPLLAAAGLWTTPTDLARFIVALQRARAGEEGYVLNKARADSMLTPNRNIWAYGLQVDTRGRTPRFWHDGSVPGYLSYLVAYNWTGQGAVVMVNEDAYNGLKIAAEVMFGIAREYGWPDFRPVRAAISIDRSRLADYAGLYEIDEGYPVTIISRGNRLYLIWALGTVYEMFPSAKDEFFIARDGLPTYVFSRDSDGRVSGVTRKWNGGEGKAARALLPAPSTNGNTTFRLPDHRDALVVSLIGDFNNWKRQQNVCQREASGWLCRVELRPGKNRFAFAVDNETVLDPGLPSGGRQEDVGAVSVITIGA